LNRAKRSRIAAHPVATRLSAAMQVLATVVDCGGGAAHGRILHYWWPAAIPLPAEPAGRTGRPIASSISNRAWVATGLAASTTCRLARASVRRSCLRGLAAGGIRWARKTKPVGGQFQRWVIALKERWRGWLEEPLGDPITASPAFAV